MSRWTPLADSRRYRKMLAEVQATGPTCGICGHPGSDSLDHIRPVSLYPELAKDPTNLRPVHGVNGCPHCPPNTSRDKRRNGQPRRCNQSKGNSLTNPNSPRSRHW